jgi:hypothetical protein
MDEALHKPKHIGVGYDQLSKIINEKYADTPDLREIGNELGISVSVGVAGTHTEAAALLR